MALTPSAAARLASSAANALKREKDAAATARLLRRARPLLAQGMSVAAAAALLGTTRRCLASARARAHSREIGRPEHCRKFAQFSDEWFDACGAAFLAAMREHHPEKEITVQRAAAITSAPAVAA